MADISKELEQIMKARYGRDVRKSIHDGINALNGSAEAERQAAEEAQKAAETAQAAAETAQEKSETASGKSEAAQEAAEEAQKAAETAQKAAETAQAATETAQEKAESASGKSEAAQEAAEAAQEAAETAQAAAETAQEKAESASGKSEAAQEAAEKAKAAAETAQEKAESASGKSEAAHEAAETAQGKAEASQAAAEAAQEGSETAQEAAETAQGKAEASQTVAEFYAEQCRQITEGLAGAILPLGTITSEELLSLSIENVKSGYMYNISDEFVTTDKFREGAGSVIAAGSNVYMTADGKWDVLAGSPVTGVKGDKETYYRRGNVNITAENVGALPQNGTAVSASKWSTQRNINGLMIDGTVNRVNYGVCSTASSTAAKSVSCPGFQLVTGAEVTVKFNNSINYITFQTATLNINNTGAKPMKYRGSSYLPNSNMYIQGTHTFRYDGAYWNLVGDLNVNTDTHAVYYLNYDPEDPDSTDMDMYDSSGLYIVYSDEDSIPNAPTGDLQWAVINSISDDDSDERAQLAIPLDVTAFDGIYQRSKYDTYDGSWEWTDWKLIPTNDYIYSKYADRSLYNNTSVNVGRKVGSSIGNNSFCFGSASYPSEVTGNCSVVLGGSRSKSSGDYSTVLGGSGNTASGLYSAALAGVNNTASGYGSVVLGGSPNTASYSGAAVLSGSYNQSSGSYSVVLGGSCNTASGMYSTVLGGNFNTALDNQSVTGHYNDETKATGGYTTGNSTGTAFCIGNGTSSAKSNAVRIDYNGKIWCKDAYSSTGADYAELFEWTDGNPDNEDRRGYFVTMVGDKIQKANAGDWILGIVSANPCVLGNTDTEWQGQFIKDEFGAYLIEEFTEIEKRIRYVLEVDENGKPVLNENGEQKEIPEEYEEEISGTRYVLNPNYDPEMEYTDRLSRPEWDAVGMMGVLSVYDDGTCQVNGFCTVSNDGTATAAPDNTGYRVIKRVSDNIVKIIFR